ncbi:hypothetical protein BDF22DRAFT_688959 [Syncephalis plumigaleata]|nr:hypothetical protein BDF22DRAFT_688959 [Syncephalis plumigaleata]
MSIIESDELATWMKACNERGIGYIDYNYVVEQVNERRKEREQFMARSHRLYEKAAKHEFKGCHRMNHPSSVLFLSWQLSKSQRPPTLNLSMDQQEEEEEGRGKRKNGKERSMIVISPFVYDDDDDEEAEDASIVQWMLDKSNQEHTKRVTNDISKQSTRKSNKRKQLSKEDACWDRFFKRHVRMHNIPLYKVLMFNESGKEVVPCFRLHDHTLKCYSHYPTTAECEFEGHFEDTSASSRGLLFLSWSLTSNNTAMADMLKELDHHYDALGIKRLYKPALLNHASPTTTGITNVMYNKRDNNNNFIWLNERHQPRLNDNGAYYIVKARDYASAASYFAVLWWKSLGLHIRKTFPSLASIKDDYYIYVADASLNNWHYYWNAESKNFNRSKYDVTLIEKQQDGKSTTTATAVTSNDDKEDNGFVEFPQNTTLTNTPFSGVTLPATPHWVYVFDWCAPIPRTESYTPPELPVRLMTREALCHVDPHGAPLEPPALMTIDNLQDFYWDSSYDEEEDEGIEMSDIHLYMHLTERLA